MSGRPPKPVSLLRLSGTYQPSRHDKRAHEPHAPGEASEKPPHWFLERQKRLYRRAVADAPRGVLRRIDERLLAAYVLHTDVMIEAAKAQNKEKLLDADGTSSAYLRILRQHTELMITLGNQLGFSPLARIRLATAEEPPREEPEGFELIRPAFGKQR
jgi:P27 family predicted phage terminase small subunit